MKQGRIDEDPQLFRDALADTEIETRLSARLIEKDYYCSLILKEWAELFDSGLAFRGGSCLSKVHAGFYRMSEDLDFAIATEAGVPRRIRREKIQHVKNHFALLPARLSCLSIGENLGGHDNCREYAGKYAYHSVTTGQHESIKVEVGLREPIIDPVELKFARTLLIHPLRREPALGPIAVKVMSVLETYAEKIRAALTRISPAIRDFYDIDYAVQKGLFDPTSEALSALVRRKLSTPGTQEPDLSGAKLAVLRDQVETQLKPVLRQADCQVFDLDRAFLIVRTCAKV